MSIAAVLRELMAAGVAGDELVAAIERIEAAEDEARATRRREQNRLNQRTSRERRQHVIMSALTDDTTYIYNTPTSTSTKSKKERKVSISIPADWSATDADRAFAASKGWPETRIDSEAQRFKDHALAGGRLQKDWSAAWRNWVTSPYQTDPRAGPAGFVPRPGSKEDRAERMQNALSKLREFANGSAAKDQPTSGGGADRPAPFGLPFDESA